MTSAQPELDPRARAMLAPVVEMLTRESSSPSSPGATKNAWTVHVADSLSGLAFEELAGAKTICDVGSGAGFPGLVLAAMLPDASVDMVDSIARKCAYIERAAAAGGFGNVRVINARAEDLADGEGREAYEAVTARAVGRLSTLAELASPLLCAGGVLVAWKGKRDPGEEAELERGAEQLAMGLAEVRWVGPYAGSENRHLHLLRKVGATPDSLPRRPGMAKKRPRGA